MLEILQTVAALAATLLILVTFHEYGHYSVARYFNVKVLRFSVGFGRPLWRWQAAPARHAAPPPEQPLATRANEDTGTEFVLAVLPLGGYVKMLDEREGFVADDQKHLAFNNKPVWQRIAIVAAGPAANFLLAFVAYWLLFATGVSGLAPVLGDMDPASQAGVAGFRKGEEIVAVGGQDTRTWQEVNMALFQRIGETGTIDFQVRPSDADGPVQRSVAVTDWLSQVDAPYPMAELGLRPWRAPMASKVGEVVPGSAADVAGLRAGDEVVAVNGEPVDRWEDWVAHIQAAVDAPLVMTVLRDGRQQLITAVPDVREENGVRRGYLGVGPEIPPLPAHLLREVSYPPWTAWLPALARTGEMTLFTLESIGKMVMGMISSSNLSGPITIARVANASAESGFESYVGFLALLSISLGVLNLLPIPVLDGGHLVYYGYEALTGRPVPERVQAWGVQVGLFFIVGLMLLAFYNDLARF